jgi:2-C-methyl-D-erythritol 2,4-cyclodiphosphate synthase
MAGIRVGIGFDLHRLAEGHPLRLAGVDIPAEAGPVAHSDGDAVFHAVADAVLGAAALGDLGEHFPDDDDTWAGADSGDILERVVDMAREAGYRPASVDVNVLLETPKLAPHRDAMRAALAERLGLAAAEVSVKARTMESLGPVGAGEAVAAQAVVVLEKSTNI